MSRKFILKGRAHKFGNDINTDDIIAAKYLDTTDARELSVHCFESKDEGFAKRVKEGDLIVAGRNFGCGSSREHAPLAIKGSGVALVIAKSFARIFFRNSINIGFPILECNEAGKVRDGDKLEVDLNKGLIKNLTRQQEYKTQKFPDFIKNLIKQGGLLEALKTNKH
jgi:3-isopropylmalate/(R)-2-methylmalate dehydratase small subunit